MPVSAVRLLVALTLAVLILAVAPREARAVQPGDVIISEMLIASGSAGEKEWIEIYNTTTLVADLSSCTLLWEGPDPLTGEEAEVAVSLSGLTVAGGSYALLSGGAACVAYGPPGTCAQAPDFVYDTFTLSDSEAQTLSLVCATSVIDEVTNDWPTFSADCRGAGSGNCAVNLKPESMSAAANDSWADNWCVPPATSFLYDSLGLDVISTPGSANLCAPPVCSPGDVIFTELMLDPPDSDGDLEWFELLPVASAGCDLHGCVLQEGPFSEITAANVADSDWTSHVIDVPGNTLPLAGGQYALFAGGSSTVVATAADGSTSFTAAYNYSALSFDTDEARFLHLRCGGETVDSAPYDWRLFEPACLGSPCSVNLTVSGEDAAGNDDLGNWCLPPLATEWVSSHADQLTYQGTPGQQGSCQVRLWPAEDQLVFTELMIEPEKHGGDGAPQFAEWFELYNPTDSPWELTGCRVLRERYDDGALLEGNKESAFLGNEVVQPVISAGEARVFSKGCLLNGVDPLDTDDELELAGCEEGEYLYSGFDLTNGNHETLSLLCPDGNAGEVLVDTAGYDMTRTGNRKGRTMQFDYSGPEETRDNADPYQWCEASLQQDIPALLTDEGQQNYGTPGVLAPCASGQVDLPPSGPGCRCDSSIAAEPGSIAFALLLLLGLPISRRRLR